MRKEKTTALHELSIMRLAMHLKVYTTNATPIWTDIDSCFNSSEIL